MKPFTTVVGIDLARRAAHQAVLMTGEGPGRGVAHRACSVTHDLAGLERLCGYIRQQTGRDSLEGVLVNMEPTSGVWPVVAAYLGLQGAEVCLTRTDLTSQWRKVHSRFHKTDPIDAKTLAKVPLSFPERVWPVRPVPGPIRVLRELSAQRQRLVEEIIRWKNRFLAVVEPVWSALLASLSESQRFSAVGRAFFRRFANPCEALRYGRARFSAWYAKHAHGLTDPIRRANAQPDPQYADSADRAATANPKPPPNAPGDNSSQRRAKRVKKTTQEPAQIDLIST